MRVFKITFKAALAAAVFSGVQAEGADGTWTNTSGGLWSVSGNWGGGTVADGADNTANFGTLNITADTTVSLDSARTLGNLIFGDTTGSHNWILNNNGNAANILTLDVAAGSPAITVNNQSATISAVIAGNDGLTKNGAGTLILSGANTFSGGINVTDGVLSISGNNDANLGAGGGSVSLSNNAALQTTSDGGTTGTGRSLAIGTGGGRLIVAGFSPRTMAFSISGSDTLSISAGSSGVRLTGNNTGFTGTYSINNGGTSFETANAAPTLANSVFINNGGGLVSASNGLYTSVQAWLDSGVIQAASTGGIWLTGVNNSENIDLSGYGSLFVGASNFINLGSPNTVNYTGTITPAGGVYRLGSSVSATHILNMNAVNQLTGTSSLVIGNGSQVGTVMLSQANNYSGGTTVNSNGNLIVANSNALGTGAVTVNAPLAGVSSGLRLQGGVNVANALSIAGQPNDAVLGVLRSVNGANTWSGAVTLTGNSRISADNAVGNSLTISGNVDLGSFGLSVATGNTSANVGGEVIISGAISGTGSVSKTNTTGTLTLSGNNSYSGATNIAGGMVALGSSTALGNGAGTLTFNAGNGATAGIHSSDSTARTISNAFAFSGGNAATTYVFGASSGGTGDLTFSSTGTAALGSVLRNFQVNNRTQFDGGFSGAGGGITKTGAGTLALAGASTYTGATAVNAGTLLVNGSLSASSAVAVNANGTLGGTGSVGAVTVALDGSIAPGDGGIESLDAAAVTMNGGSILKLEINTTAGTSDLLNVSGAFNLALANDSVLQLSLLGVDVPTGATFTLVDYGSWNGGLFTYLGSVLADDSIITLGANQFKFSYNGVDDATSAITLTAVPEPSTYALLAVGTLALMTLRRRTAKKS